MRFDVMLGITVHKGLKPCSAHTTLKKAGCAALRFFASTRKVRLRNAILKMYELAPIVHQSLSRQFIA